MGGMTKSRSEVLAESRRKGTVAGAAAVATVALAAAGAPLVLAAVAAMPTALLGWRWWKHRAENGIRF